MHKYQPTLEIHRARPMQLYTIQLPGTSIIRHGRLSCPNSIVCALPRYRGYLLKFASHPSDEPWIPWSGDWQAVPSEQRCANAKKCECTRGHFAPKKMNCGNRMPFYLPSKNLSCLPPNRHTSALIPRGSTCPDSHTIRCTQCLLPREPALSAARRLFCLEHNSNRFSIRSNFFWWTKIISYLETRFVLNH